MSKRDILVFAVGTIVGSGITALAGYFGIIRKYVPLNELEVEINNRKDELENLERQISDVDDELEAVQLQIENREMVLEYTNAQISDAQDVLQDVKEDSDPTRSAPAKEPVRKDTTVILKKELTATGNIDDTIEDDDGEHQPYIIDDGNPRWDGPLTQEEQAGYDECDGNEDLQLSELAKIKEDRFDATMDPDQTTYQISQAEHNSAPDFFDTEDLSYYDTDGILARGREIIDDIELLIDPLVLNHFDKRSMTGDPNVVICRNDEVKTDYIITRYEGSYQSAIFGIDESKAYIPKYKYVETLARKRAQEEDDE